MKLPPQVRSQVKLGNEGQLPTLFSVAGRPKLIGLKDTDS